MPESRMLSFQFLHWVFRAVELQASLGPPGFDIFSSVIHKTQAHIRIDYCTVLSSIITVKLQKQIGSNTAFLSVQEL